MRLIYFTFYFITLNNTYIKTKIKQKYFLVLFNPLSAGNVWLIEVECYTKGAWVAVQVPFRGSRAIKGLQDFHV